MLYDFDKYAKDSYLPALADSKADDATLLAAVSYVGTRGVEGHTMRLREILTTRMRSKIKREIDAACVDALVNTTDDQAGTSRFLALLATQPNPLPAANLCQDGLRRLGSAANDALLQELLDSSHDSARIRKLAILLYRVCQVPSPRPINEWTGAEADQRREAVQSWREAIQKKGGLPAEPAAKPYDPSAGNTGQ